MKLKRKSNKIVINSYQTPYIALMTILCILFLMFYAYYDKLKAEDKSQINKEIIEGIKKVFNPEENIDIEVVDEDIKIILPEKIIFDSGSSNLKDKNNTSLIRFSDKLKMLPKDYQVIVKGHTDNSPVWYGGDYTSNWELSLYRSISLIHFFVKNGNLPERFIGMGFSQYKPIFKNDNKDHKTANRRVEIIFKKRYKEYNQVKYDSST